MAHRHNRRRVRPRSVHLSKAEVKTGFSQLALPPLPLPSFTPGQSDASKPQQQQQQQQLSGNLALSPTSTTTYQALPFQPHLPQSNVPWHGRKASQATTTTTKTTTSTVTTMSDEDMEADRCRLFGGEPGDDVALCYRMLEFFGGLDYIR